VGRSAVAPLTNNELPVLPATFVDPSLASGVVYSVPSHAPVDWLALRDLQGDQALLREYGLSLTAIESLDPVSMIDLEGYGDHPAIEVCERLGCVDQNDPKAEEATEIVYSREFHMGVLKDNCLEFSGLPVREAKDRVREELLSKNLAAGLHDLTDTVICRSGDRCIVKVIKDQWFLKYSDEGWKAAARDAISGMAFYPPELKELFRHYVDWYRDWACTRRTGLGTPFPYDKDWIVETLSDSTVYMAFYIVSKHYNEGSIRAEDLSDEFFDYVILGIGDVREVSLKTGIALDVLEDIRNDFLYWYPVDLRCSATDLVGNHLTFYIFHHTALFPSELWPRGVTVNGYLQFEGQPMSKSRGWFIRMRDAVETYGADATRLTLLLSGEDLDDPDWRRRNAEAVSARVKALYGMVQRRMTDAEPSPAGAFERILLSKLQRTIESVTESLDIMKTASAARTVFYDMYNDLRGYLSLREISDRDTLTRFVETWVKLLQPFAPCLAEEIWHSVCGKEGLVSSESWPDIDVNLVSPKDEAVESYLTRALDDAKKILKALPQTPSKMTFYVAAPWKWRVTRLVLAGVSEGAKMGSVISRALKTARDVEPKEISRLVQELY
ncbi:MAG: leucine--tRNA ligase, partial [Candidatus Geothermarchaeales archaeon]